MSRKTFTNMTKTTLNQILAVSFLLLYAACGTTSEGAETTEAFPVDLAVASPTSVSEEDSTASLSSIKLSGTSTTSSTYAVATARINRILNSTSVANCTFDPELLLDQEHDAGCFGPVIEYEAHPDTTATDPLYNGTLPSGDVGLWRATDTETGHACSAAELNARMEGVSSKSLASLSGLASMICVVNNQGYAMPSSSTLTLTTDMNDLAIADVTFTTATLTHALNSSGDDEYTYNLEFTYAPSSGASYDINIDMAHVPGATPAEEYSGQLSYLVTDSYSGGNCPSSDVTHNASLQYERHTASNMHVQVRSGMFCEHGSDGRDSDNFIDPSDKYSPSNPTGWGNNFSILTANYNPSSLVGDYAYAWQAGPDDGNSRAFNLHVTPFAASDVTYTFYGYGDDIASTDGSILGFICNWAGPNSNHTYVETAQFQAVQYYSSTGTFLASLENLTYAPTSSCGYDGTGSFIYDTDGDGDMTDESNVAVTEDLFDATDIDSDGTITIEENIEATGYVAPTI